jgi:hypothetical protein
MLLQGLVRPESNSQSYPVIEVARGVWLNHPRSSISDASAHNLRRGPAETHGENAAEGEEKLAGKLGIKGGVYDIATGKVALL